MQDNIPDLTRQTTVWFADGQRAIDYFVVQKIRLYRALSIQ